MTSHKLRRACACNDRTAPLERRGRLAQLQKGSGYEPDVKQH
jgi:hypothetical protein